MSPLAFGLILVAHDPVSIRLTLKERDVPPLDHPTELDWRKLDCRAHQVPIDIRAMTLAQVEQRARQDQTDNSAKYRSESCHHQRGAAQLIFDPGEFQVDGRDIEHLIITTEFFVEVKHIKLVSKFELKNQGRAYMFEPIQYQSTGKQVEISIVHRL